MIIRMAGGAAPGASLLALTAAQPRGGMIRDDQPDIGVDARTANAAVEGIIKELNAASRPPGPEACPRGPAP